jgi:hypothetical protein
LCALQEERLKRQEDVWRARSAQQVSVAVMQEASRVDAVVLQLETEVRGRASASVDGAAALAGELAAAKEALGLSREEANLWKRRSEEVRRTAARGVELKAAAALQARCLELEAQVRILVSLHPCPAPSNFLLSDFLS